MKISELGDLEPTLDGHQVAEVFGISYWALLEMVKTGTVPVRPIRLGPSGRRLRWSTAAVLRILELGAADLEALSTNGDNEPALEATPNAPAPVTSTGAVSPCPPTRTRNAAPRGG